MHHHLHPARSLLLIIGLASAACAGAEENPYYIGASQVLSYQTNIYSVPNTPLRLDPPDLNNPCPPNNTPSPNFTCSPIDSGISTTNLVGGFDQRIGRQRVFASGTVGYNYYTNEAVRLLNHTSYSLDAGLDWETVERLSGTVHLYGNQSLANYATAGTNATTQRNIQNLGVIDLSVLYGIAARIDLTAGYAYRRLAFSSADYDSQEYSENVYRAGVRYEQSGALSYGVGVRQTQTDYPKYLPSLGGGFIADHATGNYVDFTAKWVPSGLSSLDARLSLSDISYDVNTAGDFRGLTGALGWDYQVSGKVTTRVALLVAPGTGATFATGNFGQPGGPTVENSSLNKTLRLSATYAATGKVSLDGRIFVSHNQYDQTSTTGTQTGTGTTLTSGFGLGVTYLPTRNSQLACNIFYQKRSVSQDTDLGLYAYNGSNVGCSAQLLLQ